MVWDDNPKQCGLRMVPRSFARHSWKDTERSKHGAEMDTKIHRGFPGPWTPPRIVISSVPGSGCRETLPVPCVCIKVGRPSEMYPWAHSVAQAASNSKCPPASASQSAICPSRLLLNPGATCIISSVKLVLQWTYPVTAIQVTCTIQILSGIRDQIYFQQTSSPPCSLKL